MKINEGRRLSSSHSQPATTVTSSIHDLARIVDDAAMARTEIDMLSLSEPDLTIELAYEIQMTAVGRRLERGERLVGMKMGLTSQAKMEQVGVREPIFGRLTDAMLVSDGDPISISELIHPKIEPEIAFIMKREVRGPVTSAQAGLAVAGACAALEVIDSRFRDFKFTLPDVVADNTSASRFVLGSHLVPIDQLDLGNLGIVLEVNGRIREVASSAAVLDNPLRSLAALATMLARRGEFLREGDIVLSGGATTAVEFRAGDHVRAEIEQMGTVETWGI